MRGNEEGNEESDGIENEQLAGLKDKGHEYDEGQIEETGSQNQMSNGENIVKDLLADSERSEQTDKSQMSQKSERSQQQVDNQEHLKQQNDAILKRIEQECKEEEQREAEILKQNIEEATKDIYSGDDAEQEEVDRDGDNEREYEYDQVRNDENQAIDELIGVADHSNKADFLKRDESQQ